MDQNSIEPQKTSRFTPTVIVSLVLLSTSVLLDLRLLLGKIQASKVDIFPETLFMVGVLVIMLKSLENAHRIIRIVMWVMMIVAYLLLIATYLNLKVA